MNIQAASTFNFYDHNTFIGKKLTQEQGLERLEILFKQHDENEDSEIDELNLTPRRKAELEELRQLTNVYYSDESCVRFSEKIVRNLSESYHIVFNKNPSMILEEEIENTKIIIAAFPIQSSRKILRAVLKKNNEIECYQDAILGQFGFLSNDFLSVSNTMLEHLKIIEYTNKKDKDNAPSPICNEMREEIFKLMNKQLCFFNSLERIALKIAKFMNKSLLEICDIIIDSGNVKPDSEEILTKINKIVMDNKNNTKAELNKISDFLDPLMQVISTQPNHTNITLLLSSSLASSIKIIRSTLNSFAQLFQTKFNNAQFEVKNKYDISNCLVSMREKLFSAHSLWLQSRRQWGAVVLGFSISNSESKDFENIEYFKFDEFLKLEELIHWHQNIFNSKKENQTKEKVQRVLWNWIKENTIQFKDAAQKKDINGMKNTLQKGFVYIRCSELITLKQFDYKNGLDDYFKCRDEFPGQLCGGTDSICHKIHEKDVYEFKMHGENVSCNYYTTRSVKSNYSEPDLK